MLDQPPTTTSDEKEMSFFDHLDELRSHLVRSAVVTVVIAIVIFAAGDFIFEYFIYGPRKGDFISYRIMCWFSQTVGLGDSLCMQPPEFDIKPVEMGETFFVHIRVSLILAFTVAFPFIFRELWLFIRPGLHENEAKSARGVVTIASSLFMSGVAFGYFIITPFAIKFLVSYTLGDVSNTTPTLSSYVSYLMIFMIPTGILFQLPLVVYFLSKIGLVSAELMRTYRKHAFLFIIVMAAVITPPDPVTQFLIAMPIYGLYELSISIAARQYKKYQASLEG